MLNNGDDRQPDSVEDDVRAAMAEVRGETPPEPVISAEAHNAQVQDLTQTIEGKQPAPDKGPKIDNTGRAHGQDGKFTNKPEPAKDAKPGVKAQPGATTNKTNGKATATANGGTADQILQPPSHWSPQAKADFVNAPRSIQEQALKREEEISAAQKEWGGKAEDYNRLNKVLSPHQQRWAQRGMTPDVAVNALLSFEQQLSSDPVIGVANVLRSFARGNELAVIQEIARQNGLQLVQATNQGDQPNNGQAPAQVDPTVRQLHEQVQSLIQHHTQSQAAAFQNQQKSFVDEVKAFAGKPENLYYGNVWQQMQVLIANGDANNDARPAQERLQEAYEQACWANPEIRTLLIADQAKREQAEQTKRAAAARHAGGSITGSPGTGRAAPPARQSHSSSVEDDVRAAWSSLQN